MLSFNQQGTVIFSASTENGYEEPWSLNEISDWITDSLPAHPDKHVRHEQTQQQWPQTTDATSSVLGFGPHLIQNPVASEAQSHMNYQPVYHTQTQFQPRSMQPAPQSSLTTFCAKRSHHANISPVATKSSFKAIVKRKRKRTMFTTEQVEALESVFKSKQYVTHEEKQVLVEQLQVSESSVKVWFQNRRLRGKKEAEAYLETMSTTEESSCSSQNSARLDYLEAELSQRVDESGYVTLDESSISEIVNAIDFVLSDDVDLSLDCKTADQTATTVDSPVKSEGSSYAGSYYEPISPALSDMNIEEEKWEPPNSKESLQRLFDLHFC